MHRLDGAEADSSEVSHQEETNGHDEQQEAHLQSGR